MIQLIRENKQILIFIGYCFIYFIFPTNNSTFDAYTYAGDILYNKDLFNPHHLLYSPFMYIFHKGFFTLFGEIEVLFFTKIINASFSILLFIVLYKIFKTLKISKGEAILLTSLAAFSYNLLRFGTENETYIIPIFFSLFGTYYFLKFTIYQRLKYIIATSLYLSIAVLFHQIHIFWLIGVFIGLSISTKNYKYLFFFILFTVFIPLIYLIVANTLIEDLTFGKFISFILNDYSNGTAKLEFGIMNFIMIIISIVRSFFQIHPNIIYLIDSNLIYIIPIISILTYVSFLAFRIYFKNKLLRRRKHINKVFFRTILLIMVLQLLFAFISVGNVEFIVMLPILFSATYFYFYKVESEILLFGIITLFTWNFFYGIFPNKQYNFYQDEMTINHLKDNENIVILKENRTLGRYYYESGVKFPSKIIRYEEIINQNHLNDILNKNKFIITDVINRYEILNRSKLMEDSNINFNSFNIEKIDQFQNFYGQVQISKVNLKN
jgi:hypothetical protein